MHCLQHCYAFTVLKQSLVITLLLTESLHSVRAMPLLFVYASSPFSLNDFEKSLCFYAFCGLFLSDFQKIQYSVESLSLILRCLSAADSRALKNTVRAVVVKLGVFLVAFNKLYALLKQYV